MNSCELKELQQYLTDVEDKAVGIVEYGKVTTPGVSTEDAGMLDLTPLALRKDQGYLKDEHWRNPRESHFLTSKITLPRKDGSSMELDLAKHDKRFHPGGWKEGQACKFRDELAKKAKGAQKADNADALKDYLGGKEPKKPEINPEYVESNLYDLFLTSFNSEHTPEVLECELKGNEFVGVVGISTSLSSEDKNPSAESLEKDLAGELEKGSEVSVQELTEERRSHREESGSPGWEDYVYLIKGRLSEEDMKSLSKADDMYATVKV